MNTTNSPYQFHTLLGTGYVRENHMDDDCPPLLGRDDERRELRFDEMLKALRAALAIRR